VLNLGIFTHAEKVERIRKEGQAQRLHGEFEEELAVVGRLTITTTRPG
jgi:hypothetical protein